MRKGAREVAQWLEIHTALAQDLNLVPRTQTGLFTVPVTPDPGNPVLCCGLHGHSVHFMSTRAHTHTYTKTNL